MKKRAREATWPVWLAVSNGAERTGRASPAFRLRVVPAALQARKLGPSSPIRTARAPGVTTGAAGKLSRRGSFTDPGSDRWRGTVNYGDGTGVHALSLASNRTFQLSHIYRRPGTYVVTVQVTDADGGVGTARLRVVVPARAKSNAPQAHLVDSADDGLTELARWLAKRDDR